MPTLAVVRDVDGLLPRREADSTDGCHHAGKSEKTQFERLRCHDPILPSREGQQLLCRIVAARVGPVWDEMATRRRLNQSPARSLRVSRNEDSPDSNLSIS
jgi:hypothetical protein